jgi:hypothetical protein
MLSSIEPTSASPARKAVLADPAGPRQTRTVGRYAILEAPSALGLFPGGVERLPEALLDAGLGTGLGARHAGRVPPPPYDPRRIQDTTIAVLDLATVRQDGVESVAHRAVGHLDRPELDGFWVHLDCDVLDDAVMPAVGYRLAGGLSWTELETVLRVAVASGRVRGIDITVFDPSLDPDGAIARQLVTTLVASLAGDQP